MDAAQLREGIFALKTRRFGKVAEIMIKHIACSAQGRSRFHDLYDDLQKHRIEVKFSTVLKKAEMPINEQNCLENIEKATSVERLVAFEQRGRHDFDCNIQQVKPAEFDVLYYGLFFADCVKIFKIRSADLCNAEVRECISYSDKQHKGNVGEGQFHINRDNLDIHLGSTLYQTLTYDEWLELLRPVPAAGG